MPFLVLPSFSIPWLKKIVWQQCEVLDLGVRSLCGRTFIFGVIAKGEKNEKENISQCVTCSFVCLLNDNVGLMHEGRGLLHKKQRGFHYCRA